MNVAARPEHLNLISLCTGGGGLDLGVELAIPNARAVCMVEREAFAVAELVSAMEAGLMAPAPIWSDARSFNGRAWRGAVDGLIGGIPCQPHSLAGKRLGEEDERDLWSDARRTIVQSGAWFAVIENVRGMLSSGGAERVWRDLHRLGFSVEGGLFTAAEVGASHERERVFILAVADASLRSPERWGGAGNVVRSGGNPEGQARQRQWGGCPVGDCGEGVPGVGLANAYSERLEGQRPDARAIGRPDARRSAGLRDGAALVHAERSERWPHLVDGYEPDWEDGGWGEASGGVGEPSQLVDDAARERGRRVSVQPRRQEQARLDLDRPSFPPSPAERDAWRKILERAPELEPAFRRVADGLASRLDIARVDRLRMLGNGVVPLQAAYAVRTLATRLAARGAAGAARLVRLMEITA